MKLYLRIDIIECPETGALIDYVLVDDFDHVVARLGPDFEKHKTVWMTEMGLMTGQRVTLEVGRV
jgi:hypothetical protein